MISSSSLPDNLDDLEEYIQKEELNTPYLKRETKATIVWANEQEKRKTPYVLLYLHGFKASHGEGSPIHRNVARAFGCNLFLSRLKKHGLNDPDAFSTLNAKHFIHSAEQALHIAQKIGDNVIIMGTSTGASLALYLASRGLSRSSIAALVLYSPLIQFYGLKNLFLCTHAGRFILRIIPGKNYRITSQSTKAEDRIWYSSYQLQGPLALGKLVQQTMTPATFSKVLCPVFTGYYYKDHMHRDKVVSVHEISNMYHQLGTSIDKKQLVTFPEAQTHVISNGILSNSIDEIEKTTIRFLQDTLSLKPAPG